jgi:hypothetical protein
MYRIIRGRYPLRVGDSVFLFTEPDSALIAESYGKYDEVYAVAWGDGAYTEGELEALLLEQGIWSPFEDRMMKQKQDRIDELKLQAYHSFLNKKELGKTRRQIRFVEEEVENMLRTKHKLDSMSCHTIAETARMRWLISNSISGQVDSQKLLDVYNENILGTVEVREVAKLPQWRNMWGASEKCRLFDKLAVDLSSDQLSLISYSKMYDNVYEHPERPVEDLIMDNDCLDGWFVFQKRKVEKQKTEKEVDSVIRNPKIRNSQEVYVMASSKEDAERINNMNSAHSQNIMKQRSQMIEDKGRVKQGQFTDVKQEIEMQKTDALRQQLKGKG